MRVVRGASRMRWRPPAAVPLVALVVLLAVELAGCGESSQIPGFGATTRERPCRGAAPAAPGLAASLLASTRLPAPAASLALAPHGYLFTAAQGELDVLRGVGGAGTRLVRRIALPPALTGESHRLVLTPDGTELLASAGSGAIVVDVGRAEHGGRGRILLGRLTSPVRELPRQAGAASVRITPDGSFVFVARTRATGIAVFDLRQARRSRFRTSGYVGRIPTGLGPTSLALAPDGRRLYSVSLTRAPTGSPDISTGGTLSVIDVATAEIRPEHSTLASVAAGCQPVAVATSPDGALVWVAALGDHSVLAFRSDRLLSARPAAPVATVRLHGEPTSILPSGPGGKLLVGDPTSSGGIYVVDTRTALAGRPATVGVVGIRGGAAAVDRASLPDGVIVAPGSSAELRELTIPAGPRRAAQPG